MYVHGAGVIYEKGGEGSTAQDIDRDRYREELYERTSTRIWGLEDGARGQVEGDYEGVHKCEIDI